MSFLNLFGDKVMILTVRKVYGARITEFLLKAHTEEAPIFVWKENNTAVIT